MRAEQIDKLKSVVYVINEKFDFEPAGAWLLGRDVRAQLFEHSARFDQMIGALDKVLASELNADSAQTLALQMNPTTPDVALKLLGAFHAGLLGAKSP